MVEVPHGPPAGHPQRFHSHVVLAAGVMAEALDGEPVGRAGARIAWSECRSVVEAPRADGRLLYLGT